MAKVMYQTSANPLDYAQITPDMVDAVDRTGKRHLVTATMNYVSNEPAPGWKCFATTGAMTVWNRSIFIWSVQSRHLGNGILCGHIQTAADKTQVCVIGLQFYGNIEDTVRSASWVLCYSKSTGIASVYGFMNDYDEVSIDALSTRGFDVSTNPVWSKDIPASAGEKYPCRFNDDDLIAVQSSQPADTSKCKLWVKDLTYKRGDIMTYLYLGGANKL